jgi:hypothetical protein
MTHETFDVSLNTKQAPGQAHQSPFSSLRLTQNFGETLGVKKVLTTVPVGKPSRDRFFRVHQSPDMVFPAMLLEDKVLGETYLVSTEVASALGDLIRQVELYAAIDRQNNTSLIPVPLPGPNGVRNPWHESLAQAVEKAKTIWLRISANKNLGAYDIFVATADLSEPNWPDMAVEELLEIAFKGRIITSVDHPIVQERLGKI